MSQETDLAAIYEHREAYNRALGEGGTERGGGPGGVQHGR